MRTVRLWMGVRRRTDHGPRVAWPPVSEMDAWSEELWSASGQAIASDERPVVFSLWPSLGGLSQLIVSVPT